MLVLLLAAALAAASPAPAAPADPYAGLGAWIDVYDRGLREQPEAAVASLNLRGVRTIYLETSNFNARYAIVDRDSVARLIVAAHAIGMQVVAWYLPGYADPAMDRRRALAALRFRAADGERFDSVALDIESVRVPLALRNARAIALARYLRAAAGDEMPLGAIIPSPSGMALSRWFWPHFPYAGLARSLDVFLPMSYFTNHVRGPAQVRRYVAADIAVIRSLTGRPVHVIGGAAGRANASEIAALVRAAGEQGAIGVGIYDAETTTEAQWAALQASRIGIGDPPPALQ
jgi:hypothetical protein